jgi:sugar phosphate isomerase/epimerase
MLLSASPPIHLTYCLNIHPGEHWNEQFQAIRTHALTVRRAVCPDRSFGLGLRLGRQAAEELSRDAVRGEFQRFLREEGCYVFTINGFPYGTFHNSSIKQNVYAPDWRTPERLAYTLRLAELLAELLPSGQTGSISTVPGSYKPWMAGDADVIEIEDHLTEAAEVLATLYRDTGRRVRLALEPEPDCFLETTDEAVAFLTPRVAKSPAWREHIGVCVDLAHSAVAFEDPAAALMKLVAAGIAVPKVQLSAALRVVPTAARRRLADFLDPVYLHQVKARLCDGTIRSYADLAEALATERDDEDCWAVHFHVPLFHAGDETLGTTQSLYDGRLRSLLQSGVSEHLEIETYTFSVLPEGLRPTDVAESIRREYQWALAYLEADS